MAALGQTLFGASQKPASVSAGNLTMKALRQQSLGLLADPSPLVFEGVCPGETMTAVLRLVNRTPRSVRAFVTLPPPQSPLGGVRLPPAGQGGIGGSTWSPTALAEPAAEEPESGPFSFFLESKGTLHPGAEQLVWVTFRCPPLPGVPAVDGSLPSVTGSVYDDGGDGYGSSGAGMSSVSPAGVAAALAGGRSSTASAVFASAFAAGARHYSGQLVVRYAELAHPTAATASSLGTDRAAMMGLPTGPLTGEAATMGGLGTGFGQAITMTVPLVATAVPARLLLHPPFLNGGGASVLPRVPPGSEEVGPGLGLGTLAMASSTASLLTVGSTGLQQAGSASASSLLPPLPGAAPVDAATAAGGRTRAALHAAVNTQAPLLEFGPVPLLQPARYAIRLGNPGGCPLKVTLSISGSEPAVKPLPDTTGAAALTGSEAAAEATAASTTAAREEFGLALPRSKRGTQPLPAGARSPGRSPSRQRLGGPPPPREIDGPRERPPRPEWGSVHSIPSVDADGGRHGLGVGSVSFSGDGYGSRSRSPMRSQSHSPAASPLRGSPWHSLDASPAASPLRGSSPQHTPALGLSPEASMELPPQLPMPRSFARVGAAGRPGGDGDGDGAGEGNYDEAGASGRDEDVDEAEESGDGSRGRSGHSSRLVLRKRRGSPVSIPTAFATTPAAAVDQQGAPTLTLTLPPRSQRRVYVQFRPLRVRTAAALLQIDSVPQLPAWATALEEQGAGGLARPRTSGTAEGWGNATGTRSATTFVSSSGVALPSATPSVMQVRVRLAGSALPGGVREAASAVLAAAAASSKQSSAIGRGDDGVDETRLGADGDDGAPSPERLARFNRTYTGASRHPAHWLKTDPGLALIDARLDGYKAQQSRRLAAVLRARAAAAEASRAADESEDEDELNEDEDDEDDEGEDEFSEEEGPEPAGGEGEGDIGQQRAVQGEGEGASSSAGAGGFAMQSMRRSRRRRAAGDDDGAEGEGEGGHTMDGGALGSGAGAAGGIANDPADEVFTDDWYDPRSLAHAGGWSAAEKNAAAYRQILDLGSSGWVAPSSMRGHGAVAFVLGRRKAALRRAARAQAASAAAAATGHVPGSSGAGGGAGGKDGSQTGPAGVGFLSRAGTGRTGQTGAGGPGGGNGAGGGGTGPPRGPDGASLAAEPFVQRYVANKASAGVLAAPAPQSQGHIVPASEVLAAAAAVASSGDVNVAPGLPSRGGFNFGGAMGSMASSSVVGTAAVVPVRPDAELSGSAAPYLTAGDLLAGVASPGDIAAWEADAAAAASAVASAMSGVATSSAVAVTVEGVSGGVDGGAVPLAFRLTPASVSTLVLTEQAIARRQAAVAAVTGAGNTAPDAIAAAMTGVAGDMHAAAQAQAHAFEQQRRAALAAASARLTTAAAAVAPPRPPTVAELSSSAGVLLALEMSRSWLYPLLRLRGDAAAIAAAGSGGTGAGSGNSNSFLRSKSLRSSGGFTATASGRKLKGPLLAGRRLLPSELPVLLAVLSPPSPAAGGDAAASLASSAPPLTGACIDFLLGAAWDEYSRGGAPAPPLTATVAPAAAGAGAGDGAAVVSIAESNLTKLVRLLAAAADAPLPHRKQRKSKVAADADALLLGGGSMTTAGRSVHVTPSSAAALAGHASRHALASYDVTVRLAPAAVVAPAFDATGVQSPSPREDAVADGDGAAELSPARAQQRRASLSGDEAAAAAHASHAGAGAGAAGLRTASRGSIAPSVAKSRAGSAVSRAGRSPSRQGSAASQAGSASGSRSPSPTRRMAASRAEALGIGRGVGFSAGDAGAAEVRGAAEASGLVSSRTAAAHTAADLAGIGGMTAMLKGNLKPFGRGRLTSPLRGANGRSASEGPAGANGGHRIAVTVLVGAAGAGANALLRGAQVTGPQLPLQVAAAMAKARGIDLVSFGQTTSGGPTQFTTGAAASGAAGAGSHGVAASAAPSPLPPAARALASTMRWGTVSHTLAARQAAVARIAAAAEAEAAAAASRATAARRGVPPGAAPSPALSQLLQHVRQTLRALEAAVTARLRSLRLSALPMPDARFGTPLALVSAASAPADGFDASSAMATTSATSAAFDRTSLYGGAGKRRMSLTGEAPAVVALRVAHRNSVAGLEAQLGVDGATAATGGAAIEGGAAAGTLTLHSSSSSSSSSAAAAASASSAAAAVRARAAFVAALHSPRLYPPLSLYAALTGMRLSSLLLAHPTLRHALLPDGAGLGAMDESETAADGAGDAAGVNGTDATEASAAAAASAALTAVVAVCPPLPPAAVQATPAELASAIASAAPGNRAAADAAAAAAKAAGSADGATAASALMAARAQSLLQVRSLLADELVRQRVAGRLARLARTAPHWLTPPAAHASAHEGLDALASPPDAATAQVLARTAGVTLGATAAGAAPAGAPQGMAGQSVFDGIRAPAYLAYLQQEGWAERSWLLTPPTGGSAASADLHSQTAARPPSIVDDLLADLPESNAMPLLPSHTGHFDAAHDALAAALSGASGRPSTGGPGGGAGAGVVSSDWDRAGPALARMFLSPGSIGAAHVASIMDALPLPVPFPAVGGTAATAGGARCGFSFGMQLAASAHERAAPASQHDIGAAWRCGLQTLATTEEVDVVLPDATPVRAARCAAAARAVASAALLSSVANASRAAAAAAASSTASLSAARKRGSIVGGAGAGGKVGELPGGVSEADAVSALLAAAGSAAPAGGTGPAGSLMKDKDSAQGSGGAAAWLPGHTALSFSLLNAAVASPPAVPAVGALPAGIHRGGNAGTAVLGAAGPVATTAMALAAAGLLPTVSSGVLPPQQAPHGAHALSASPQPWALLAASPEAVLSLCMTPLSSFLGDLSLGAATIASFGLPLPDERAYTGAEGGGDAASTSGCAGTTAGPDSFANAAVGRSTGLLLQGTPAAAAPPAAVAALASTASADAAAAGGAPAAAALVPAAGAYERPPLDGVSLDGSSTMWRSVASGATGTGVWGLTPLPLPLTPWLNYLPTGGDQPLRESALSLTAIAHSCAGGWGALPLPQGVVRGAPTLSMRLPAALPPPASAGASGSAPAAAAAAATAVPSLPPFGAIARLAPDPVVASAVAALLPAGAAATAPPGASGMAREAERTRDAAVALAAALANVRHDDGSYAGSEGDDVVAALRAFGISPSALPSIAAASPAAATEGAAVAASPLPLFPPAEAMWPLLRLPPSGSLQGLRLPIAAPPPASAPGGVSAGGTTASGAGPLHWAFAELGFEHPRWRLAAVPGLLSGGGAGGGTGGIGGPSVLLHPRFLGGAAADNAALAAAYAAAGAGAGPLPAAAAQALLHTLPSVSLTGGDAGSSAWLLSGPPLEGAADYGLQPIHDVGGGLRAGQAEAHGGAGFTALPLPLPPWMEPPTSLAALVASVPPVGCAGVVAGSHAVGAGGSLSFDAAASLPGLMLARDASAAGPGPAAPSGAASGAPRTGLLSSAASVAGSTAGAGTGRPQRRISGTASVASGTTGGGGGASGSLGGTLGKRSVRFVGTTAASRTVSAGAAAAATLRNASRFAAAEPASATADGGEGAVPLDSDRSSFAAAAAAKTVKPSASGAASAAAQAAAAAAVAASVAVVQGALARRKRLHLAAAAEEAAFVAIAAAAAAAQVVAGGLHGGGPSAAAGAGAGRASVGTRSTGGHGGSAAGRSHSGSVAASRVYGSAAGGGDGGAAGMAAFGASGSYAGGGGGGGAFLAGGGSYAGGASGFLPSHAERSNATGAAGGGGPGVAAALGLGLAPSRGGLWHPTALASRYGVAPVLDPNGSLVTLRSALGAGGAAGGSFFASLSQAPSLAAIAAGIGAASATADGSAPAVFVLPLPLLDAARFAAAAAVAAVASTRSAGSGIAGGPLLGAGAPALPFAALRAASIPLALALASATGGFSQGPGVPRPIASVPAALAAALGAAGQGALSLLSVPSSAAHLHAAYGPPPRGGLAGAASGMHGAALLLAPAPPAIRLPLSPASASASSTTAGAEGDASAVTTATGTAAAPRPPQRSPTDVLPFAQRAFIYAPHNAASALLQRMDAAPMDVDAAGAASGEGAEEAAAEAKALAEAEDGVSIGALTLSQLLGLAPTPSPAALAGTLSAGGFGFSAAALGGPSSVPLPAGMTRSLLTVPLPGSLSFPLPLACGPNAAASYTTGLSFANAERVATSALLPPLLARPIPTPDAQAHFDSESEGEESGDDDDEDEAGSGSSSSRTLSGTDKKSRRRRAVGAAGAAGAGGSPVRNSRGLIDPAAAAAAVVKPVSLAAALAAFVPPELQAGVASHAAALDAAYDAWKGGSAATPVAVHHGAQGPPADASPLSLPLALQGWAGLGGLGTVGLAPPLPLVPSKQAVAHAGSAAIAGSDGAPLATVAERAQLASDAAAALTSHATAGALPALLAGSRFGSVLLGAEGQPPFDMAAQRAAGGQPVTSALQALRQAEPFEPAASGLNSGSALADRRFRVTAHEL